MIKYIAILMVLTLVLTGCAKSTETTEQDTTGSTEDTGVNTDLTDSENIEEDLDALEEIDTSDLVF